MLVGRTSEEETRSCFVGGPLIFFFTLNPLTLELFAKKTIFWTFWRFSGWISAKLQHDSLPFLPLASQFMTFWLGHALK